MHDEVSCIVRASGISALGEITGTSPACTKMSNSKVKQIYSLKQMQTTATKECSWVEWQNFFFSPFTASTKTSWRAGVELLYANLSLSQSLVIPQPLLGLHQWWQWFSRDTALGEEDLARRLPTATTLEWKRAGIHRIRAVLRMGRGTPGWCHETLIGVTLLI